MHKKPHSASKPADTVKLCNGPSGTSRVYVVGGGGSFGLCLMFEEKGCIRCTAD